MTRPASYTEQQAQDVYDLMRAAAEQYATILVDIERIQQALNARDMRSDSIHNLGIMMHDFREMQGHVHVVTDLNHAIPVEVFYLQNNPGIVDDFLDFAIEPFNALRHVRTAFARLGWVEETSHIGLEATCVELQEKLLQLGLDATRLEAVLPPLPDLAPIAEEILELANKIQQQSHLGEHGAATVELEELQGAVYRYEGDIKHLAQQFRLNSYYDQAWEAGQQDYTRETLELFQSYVAEIYNAATASLSRPGPQLAAGNRETLKSELAALGQTLQDIGIPMGQVSEKT